MYNELRTLAFQFAPDMRTLEHTFYTLAFPAGWKSVLRELQTEITGDPKKSRPPIKTLNKTFRALVPDLISIVPNADLDKIDTWLYSAKPIDLTALHIIIHQWLNTAFPKASDASLNRVRKKLRKEDLQWQEKTLNLAHWDIEPNGTTKLDNDLFVILPDFFAAQFSDANTSLRLEPEVLHFRRSPLAPGGKGAELVSWPPLCYSYESEKGKKNWWWSVVITLTVQTVPFQSFPVIYCELGVRRWVSAPNTSIPKGETSVALLTQVPWLEGLPQTNSFQVAPLKWEYIPEKEQQDDQKFRVVWASYFVALLEKLQIKKAFPTPATIRNNPEKELNLNGSPNFAILYREGMTPRHQVGPGFWPGDRCSLAEQIEKLLAPMLVFTEPPTRVKYRSPKPSNPFFEKEGKNNKQSQLYKKRRRLIGRVVGGQLTLEIRYQSQKVRDEILKVICDYLGTTPGTLNNTWKTEELTITVKSQLLGAIGDNLKIDYNNKKVKERLHQAIYKRVEEIKSSVPQPTNTSAIATLIEISGAEAYKKIPEEDPKHALRIGFAHRNRLTQFITPEQKKTDDDKTASLSHRAKASFLDILRQLGVQADEPNIPLKGLPSPLNYVGIWLVKQYAKSSATRTQQMLPVLVYLASNSTEIKATAPGLGDSWLPYPEVLLKMAQKQGTGLKYKGDIMTFIKDKLENDVIPCGDTLLLCHAQNLRSRWNWLKNPNLMMDKLAFDKETPQPVTNWDGLRIVRIRSSQSHETPEWYAQKNDDVSFSKGLFKITERVFASTYNKPKQFQKISTDLSKISTWTNKSGKTYDASPQTYAWNPELFELTVACIQPGDEIWQWAAVAHELRNIAIHHDEPTALPLPLQLAKQIGEYTLSIEKPLEEADELEDEQLDSAWKQL